MHLLDIALHAHGEQAFYIACLAFAAVGGFTALTLSLIRLWRSAPVDPEPVKYAEWEYE